MIKESVYKDVEYFTAVEMRCKCGCRAGAELMDVGLLRKLDGVRKLYAMPIVINSGYRCKIHNRAVGGGTQSSHLVGKAVDVRVKTDLARYKLILCFIAVGFSRIGIGKGFIHVDVDETKNNKRMWIY